MSELLTYVLLDLTRPDRSADATERLVTALREEEWADLGKVFVLAQGGCPPILNDVGHLFWISTDDAVRSADAVFQAAARADAMLLVLMGAHLPEKKTVVEMAEALGQDPYFGFALPRIAGEEGVSVRALDERFGDPEVPLIPMEVLSRLPSVELVDDVLFRGVLIRDLIVRDFETLDTGMSTVWGAFRELMARARRVGFRTVLANKAFVEIDGSPLPDESELMEEARLTRRYAEMHDYLRDWARWGRHAREGFLARHCSSNAELSRAILLDLRDLGALYNGTSEAVMGLLRGFREVGKSWQIRLWVSPEASRFHALEQDFPEFLQVWPEAGNRFVAVFRPIQPWSLQQIESLHQHGFFVFVMMFDTILNESRIGAPAEIDKVWSALGRISDGIFYISEFTRDRFRRRFHVDETVVERVVLLATHPDEYDADPENRGRDFIFIVGNHLPHKWMEPTVRDLARAFPYQALRSLGFEDDSIEQLKGLPSGSASEDEVSRLYRDASLIVYPSQYEGFGIPVVRGLANGKTVIARHSSLLEELADHYDGPGTLHAYSTSSELIERVAETIHQLPRSGVAFGNRLEEKRIPRRYADVAREILQTIESRLSSAEPPNWERRQALFELARSYRSADLG